MMDHQGPVRGSVHGRGASEAVNLNPAAASLAGPNNVGMPHGHVDLACPGRQPSPMDQCRRVVVHQWWTETSLDATADPGPRTPGLVGHGSHVGT